MATKTAKLEKKYFGKFKEPLTTIPNLVTSQIESFDWLIKEGLKEVFQEFSSIGFFIPSKVGAKESNGCNSCALST